MGASAPPHWGLGAPASNTRTAPWTAPETRTPAPPCPHLPLFCYLQLLIPCRVCSLPTRLRTQPALSCENECAEAVVQSHVGMLGVRQPGCRVGPAPLQ